MDAEPPSTAAFACAPRHLKPADVAAQVPCAPLIDWAQQALPRLRTIYNRAQARFASGTIRATESSTRQYVVQRTSSPRISG